MSQTEKKEHSVASDPASCLTLEVVPEKKKYLSNENITLQITVSNRCEKAEEIVVSDLYNQLTLMISRPDSSQLIKSPTADSNRQRQSVTQAGGLPVFQSERSRRLDKKSTLTYREDLASLGFVLAEPGKFNFQASLALESVKNFTPYVSSHVNIKSKVHSITIVEN